jgi:hypothetical protein
MRAVQQAPSSISKTRQTAAVQAASHTTADSKQQAGSSKQQAASSKQQEARSKQQAASRASSKQQAAKPEAAACY